MNPGDATATIDLSSMRAYKARAAYLFHEKWFRVFIRVAALACFCIWVATVFMEQNALGYLFLGLAGLLATPLLWYYGELEKLAPTDTGRVDSVLDRMVLAQLHPTTTSRDLVAILSKQPGMYFFASRFSITREMLDAMADYVPIETIWTRALSIQHQLELETIDSSVLVAAICLSVPNADAVLGRLELDTDDILTGVKWFAHIQETIAVHTERKNYGGIGRDLSFGWAPTLLTESATTSLAA
jgi:hypothetical protein